MELGPFSRNRLAARITEAHDQTHADMYWIAH